MEAINIILIIIADILAFFVGFVLGKVFKAARIGIKIKKRAVRKNSDWHQLMYYTPGESTDSSVIKYKGEGL